MAKNTERVTDENYVIGLRDDQWQLVVEALRFVNARANFSPTTQSINEIDKFCRRSTITRIDAIIDEIKSNVSSIE